MSDEEFLSLINRVEPIPNRCDSDELTYCMHIIIRYEIERDLINGKIACKDVPAIWNKKYLDYLGVKVPDDGEGCMQDIHWTDASIGYFPSYALGNLYGAQILNTMKKDLDFEGLIEANKVDVIKKSKPGLMKRISPMTGWIPRIGSSRSRANPSTPLITSPIWTKNSKRSDPWT